jgi:hypothetical protein
VSDQDFEKHKQARGAIERIAEVARRGQARFNAYRQGKSSLGSWVRSRLFGQKGQQDEESETGRSLQDAMAERHLPERRRVYRNGGGERSSAAAQALERVKEALRHKSD